MIGTSTWDYVHIQFWIVLLRSLVFVSLGYSCYLFVAVLLSLTSFARLPRLPLVLEAWAVLDTLFIVFVYLPRRWSLQSAAIHPDAVSREQRIALSERCLATVDNPESYLSKWFMGVPLAQIRRDNVKEFFCWAFLDGQMTDAELDDEELEGYVSRMEEKFGIHIPPGRADIQCLRLTLDRVPMLERSLFWYLVRLAAIGLTQEGRVDVLQCIMIVDMATSFRLHWHRFHHYRTPLVRFLHVFPPRTQTLLSRHVSPSAKVSYWHRPHTSTTRLPVLFLHGIGIGLFPYAPFLAELNRPHPDEDGEPGVIALEIMPVSFRITSPALSKHEMRMQIQTILRHHGWTKYVLVTHSYAFSLRLRRGLTREDW